jgi:anti-sigma factor RsiW
MTCDSVAKLIPLYFYGELPSDEEDRVEAHLHECAACARELDRLGSLSEALSRRSIDLPASLLEDCRADLHAAIQGGAPLLKPQAKGPWTLFLEAMAATFSGFSRLRVPAAALAMLALGFLGARFTSFGRNWTQGPVDPDNTIATVRSVQPDGTGGVQITLDETHARTVSGPTNSPQIQKLLLAAFHQNNPDVRVESVNLLQTGTDTADVRDALLSALEHDPNAGVRLKALDKLKPLALAADPEVRKTLARVLLTDDNAAIRLQVVDLMTTRRDEAMVGAMQNAIQREENSGVRQKMAKALKDMNASVGTF